MIAIVAHLSVTELYLARHHWKIINIFGFTYHLRYFIVTKMSGVAIYPFLTWEDWRSPALIVGVIGFFDLVWLMLAKISESTRPVPITT